MRIKFKEMRIEGDFKWNTKGIQQPKYEMNENILENQNMKKTNDMEIPYKNKEKTEKSKNNFFRFHFY